MKKLNWAPDIIHVHGWMASLLPLYIKEYYSDEPLFLESKIVTSVYNKDFEGSLNSGLVDKIKFDKISDDKISILQEPNYTNIIKVQYQILMQLFMEAQKSLKKLQKKFERQTFLHYHFKKKILLNRI